MFSELVSVFRSPKKIAFTHLHHPSIFSGPGFHRKFTGVDPVLHGPLDDLVAVRARLRKDAGLELRLARLGAQVGLNRLGLDDVPWVLRPLTGAERVGMG